MIAQDPTVAPALAAQELMRELVLVWLGFERRLAKAPVVERIEDGRVTAEEYRALLRNLRAQVVEGARWITRAASNFGADHLELRSEVIGHAQEEHRDYEMLEKDYAAMGGDVAEMRRAQRNIGTEALSAFMFQQASQPDPVDLLGAMFIIEGLGNHMAARWAGRIQAALGVGPERHLEKLARIAGSKAVNHGNIPRIVKTAKVVARLYILQLEELDHV
jgi:3-oxoacyl-[acyl-carrier-protein] synthase-3